MFKVDQMTWQLITQAISKCAINSFYKGVAHQKSGCTGDAKAAIGEEYDDCMKDVYVALGGEIKQ